MPPLSASAARGINRTPLTPKIAATATASRSPHTPSVQQQQRQTTTTSTRSQYDERDIASPASAFAAHLSSNITPRSGSRQNRVDSANKDRDARSPLALSSSQFEGDPAKRPLVTFNAVSPEQRSGLVRSDTSSTEASNKFFHASDIKMSRPTSPTFFYANQTGIPSRPVSPGTLSPALSSSSFNLSQENVSSKFIPPPLATRPSQSSLSSSSRAPTASKLPTQSQAPMRSNSSLQGTLNRSHITSPPPLGPSPPGLRRPGTATSRSSGHSRSGSLVMGESPNEPANSTGSIAPSLFPPAQLSPGKPPPLTLASIIQAAEELSEQVSDDSPDGAQSITKPSIPSGLQSPTKSTYSATDATELVANARRERKVQDLQIRNASLEAINRTLERQLRKQTAELRRYRRLSRSGRLSIASTTASSRIPSETLSEGQLGSLGLSDLSEEDNSYLDDLEDESFSDSDSTSSNQSPSIIAARDARQRQRDEDRLALDLSKHQQLLIDSQKINQSIKRCMDWTEELIKEGKKALEYQVRVSDVKIGGRVLDPLDEGDDSSRLLLPEDTTILLDDILPLDDSSPLDEPTRTEAESAAKWAVEPQDRDSGIEIPKDGA
ncbi:hypothetical protein F5Y16DRAFT_411050 [Xylariaceae sp. FL0255]|nr:hypothetical protein F5Y16DRAFT_411050 [Xylariaceae sp. FL0255]